MDEIEKLVRERHQAFGAIREIREVKTLLDLQLNNLVEQTIVIDRKLEGLLRKCSNPLLKHSIAKE